MDDALITDGIHVTVKTGPNTLVLLGEQLADETDALLGRTWFVGIYAGEQDEPLWHWTITEPCDPDPQVEVRRVMATVRDLAAAIIEVGS